MCKNIFTINSYVWLHNFYSETLPANGETVIGTKYRASGGGKGADEAFAAAYEGCHVELIGRMGDDIALATCREECAAAGIGTQYIQVDEETPSGCGCILFDNHGGNEIVIIPGASDNFCPRDFDRAADYVRTCAIGGFQFEVNVDTVTYCIEQTHRMGVQTFVDPAPVTPIPKTLYQSIDYIKPNEFEASQLTGIPVTDQQSAVAAGQWFLEQGVNKAAIVTLGGDGCVLVTPSYSKHYPAHPVTVVDPICAGDSFAGSFMCSIANGKPLEEAMHEAICLAALIVTRQGSMQNCFFDSREQLAAIKAAYYAQRGQLCQTQ